MNHVRLNYFFAAKAQLKQFDVPLLPCESTGIRVGFTAIDPEDWAHSNVLMATEADPLGAEMPDRNNIQLVCKLYQ